MFVFSESKPKRLIKEKLKKMKPNFLTYWNSKNYLLVSNALKYFVGTKKTKLQTTARPSKRFNEKNLGVDVDTIYKKAENNGKSVVFILDMSGSITLEVYGNALTIIHGILDNKEVIDLKVILTFNTGYAMLDTPELIKDVLLRMEPFSSTENIQETIKSNMPLIQASDLTIVYTDAQIVDGHIQEEEKRAMSKNRVLGMVVGKSYMTEEGLGQEITINSMKQHFSEFLIARDVVDAANKIGTILK
jgi:hypothetical protein